MPRSPSIPQVSIRRTALGVRELFGRPGPSLVGFVAGGIYVLLFSYANGTLTPHTGIGFETTVVADPFARSFEPGVGRFSFEPIASFDLWVVRYLFSPLDAAIAVGIGMLVGINVGFVYLILRHPRACGISTYSGVVATIPALLASGACCVPVIVLIAGITAGGWVIVAASWLLPVGVLLLVASLVSLARRVAPATSR